MTLRQTHSSTPRKRRGALAATTALLLALALIASACGSNDPETAAPSDTAAEVADPVGGGQLNMALFQESNGWLPAGDLWAQSGYTVARTIFDPLTTYDANGEIKPYLAESVEPTTDDFTEWVITLRPGIEFHDGTPLDADAVITHLSAMNASPIWGQFFGLVEEMTATGELEVTLQMNTPFSTFPHVLSIQPGYVAAPAQYEAEDARNPIGTGPFVFDEWVIDDHLRVSRNPDYWQEGLPYVDVVEFQVLTDTETRRGALESGDVDLMEIQDAGTLAALETDGGVELYINEDGETTERAILLNSLAAPFDNENARMAVAHAIDKDLLSRTVFEGRFPTANGMFAPESPWYQDVQYPVYDPDLAAEYATAYGEETGEQLSFALQTLPDSDALAQSQLMQQMMDAAGIEMGVQTVESTALIVNAVTGGYQAMAQELLFGSQHPDREYPIMHGGTGGANLSVNMTGIDNANVNEGLDATRETLDIDAQIEAWKQVQEGLAEDNTILFLVHAKIGLGSHDWVKGLLDTEMPDGEPKLDVTQTIPWLTEVWIDR